VRIELVFLAFEAQEAYHKINERKFIFYRRSFVFISAAACGCTSTLGLVLGAMYPLVSPQLSGFMFGFLYFYFKIHRNRCRFHDYASFKSDCKLVGKQGS